MTEEKKTSDSVRITRIVSPTVLIIALALIFKGELSGSMDRGCFEISIEHAGIDMKDQSLCSVRDINNMAGEMTQLGATKAEERADSAFAKYESLLIAMGVENEGLQKEIMELQMINREMEERAFELARAMEDQINNATNPNAREGATIVYNQYVETFDVPQFRLEEPNSSLQPAEPKPDVREISSDIRSTYIQRAQVDVKEVQSQIKVRKKK